jgi:hypothetical protein
MAIIFPLLCLEQGALLQQHFIVSNLINSMTLLEATVCTYSLLEASSCTEGRAKACT